MELENQCQIWREKIESRDVDATDINIARTRRFYFENKMKTHQDNMLVMFITSEGKVKQELSKLIQELDQIRKQVEVQLIRQCSNFINSVNRIIKRKGLTPQRIQRFERFTAGESFVGDQCVICMEDIEIGRNMLRLDCDGQHTFCQVCIEKWFANHKTCPTCRHEF